MSKSLEEKINDMHDVLIRLEPFCVKVDKHEKTLYNGGWGIAAQVKVIWGIGIIIVGVLVKVLTK